MNGLLFNHIRSVIFRHLWRGCSWANLSQSEQKHYLEVSQGPQQRFTKGKALSLTIYYSAILAVGVPGNLLTCFIIATNSYMRTPPNFFLFNLAVVDLLTLVIGKCQISTTIQYNQFSQISL